jgi:predicted RND superfamily exporter protein
VGPAVVVDAAALALGFGVLILSRVPANARLGGLMVASLLACLAASLVLVPALARTRER